MIQWDKNSSHLHSNYRMSGKCFTYFYSFTVSSLQPSEVGTICLSLASKESRAWSRGFHTLLYTGCHPKEAGVREEGQEARKGEVNWKACYQDSYHQVWWIAPPPKTTHPLMRPSCEKPRQLHWGQSYRRRREELLIYHFSSALWHFLSTHTSGLAHGTPQCQQGSLRNEGLRWGTL